jgi:hypothetical protein
MNAAQVRRSTTFAMILLPDYDAAHSTSAISLPNKKMSPLTLLMKETCQRISALSTRLRHRHRPPSMGMWLLMTHMAL